MKYLLKRIGGKSLDDFYSIHQSDLYNSGGSEPNLISIILSLLIVYLIPREAFITITWSLAFLLSHGV